MKDDRLAGVFWPIGIAFVIGAIEWLLLLRTEPNPNPNDLALVAIATGGGFLVAEAAANVLHAQQRNGRYALRVFLLILILVLFAIAITNAYQRALERDVNDLEFLLLLALPLVYVVRGVDWRYDNDRSVWSELRAMWSEAKASFGT